MTVIDEGASMNCPHCSQADHRVTESQVTEDGVRRSRKCRSCGRGFSTIERVQRVEALVVKRDGRREQYQREKLTQSLRMAARKRPLAAGALDAIADDVERRLAGAGQPEVGSRVIGEMAITHLQRLDPIAYIRFASAYRQFVSLDDMLTELQQIGASPLPPAEQPRLFHDEMERIVSGNAAPVSIVAGEGLPHAPTPIESAPSAQPS